MRESRENRAERLSERAAKIQREADASFARGREMASVIPLGQPILVGHHSERRDRGYRAKIDTQYRRAAELSNYADDLERRSEAAAANTTIYADALDPVADIDARLAKMKEHREIYKKINALIRKNDRVGLLAIVKTEAAVTELFLPDFAGRIGIPDYKLTNLGANIRRLEKRRVQLAALKSSERTERTVGDIKIIEDPDLARIQLFFDGKPAPEVRDVLKRHGFRWAPSAGAWQRQLNNAGRYAARQVLAALEARA